ncbi:MAG TPA: flippase [Candidatus Magasanikbacteria bacterium]|nr:flippase [Candidatus Magasanikbacteria bacterium]
MKQISLGQSTLYMTLASIAQKLISFVYFAIIARTLGAEDTGKYFFALSFTTIFVVFVDLGLTNVMVREGAKAKERVSEFLSSIIFLKFFLGLATYVVMAVTLIALGYTREAQVLVFISGITMLTDSLQLSLYGTLRALGNIKYEAYGIIGSQFLTLVLGTTFLYFKLPLFFLMIAFLVPSFLNMVFAWTVVTIKYRLKLRPHYSREIVFYLLPIAVPFALATIFGRVFAYADSVMLSKIAGDVAVGWYSVPYKIAYAFQFIPFALIAGLYPRMSEYFAHDKKRLGEVFSQGLRYLLVVSIPMCVGIMVLAHQIINTFFGREYSPSVVPLQILMVGVVAGFVNVLLGALLNATGKQKTQTTYVGITMLANIILNFILIPKMNIQGAAIAATLGNILLFVISWITVSKNISIAYDELRTLLMKLGVSSAAMGVVVWYTALHVQVFVAAVIGGIVFGVLFTLMKGLTTEDIAYFKSIRSKKT